MSLISAKHLAIGHSGRAVAQHISFEINADDFVCIVGPNGSGKSTLVQTLLGLIPPISGQLKLQLPTNAIGFLPQESKIDPQFPASVLEITLSGFLNQLGHRISYSRAQKQLALQHLSTLGLSKQAHDSFHALSGGQRQKALLARALCASSQILILDEPSNNLDQTSKRDLYKVLRQLNQDRQLTILMVTHDLDHQNLLGNKILALDSSRPFFGETAAYVQKLHQEAPHA